MAEELGSKVVRANSALERVRGVGDVGGVRIVVDSENKIVSVDGPLADSILAAYREALADAEPQICAAMRELDADPRIEAITEFVTAKVPLAEDADEDAEWADIVSDPLGHRTRRR